MSALGADVNGPSEYQRTKGAAEALVRATGLDWTIFRPSVMFGREDRFLNLFALLPSRCRSCCSPAPMRASSRCLSKTWRRHSCAACERATLRQVLRPVRAEGLYAARTGEAGRQVTGHRRPIIGLNDTLSLSAGVVLELLPVKLMTRDNYYSMKVDNVSDRRFRSASSRRRSRRWCPSISAHDSPRARYRRVPRPRAARERTLTAAMAQYTLVIGNKAYSSWSLRPWLLHEAGRHRVRRG